MQVASSLGYGRTDALTYFDQLAKWVTGQVQKATCTAPSTCAGLVESQTDYDPASALPIRGYQFGKLQQVIAYNADGTIASVQDGAGNRTTFSNWKRGLPQKVTYPATPDQSTPVSETAVVDANGWVTSLTDGSGYKTCYAYDAMGRVKQITYPSETQAGVCDESRWAATKMLFRDGYAAAYGVPAGHWRQITYNGRGRKLTIYDALWRPVVEQSLDLDDVPGTTSEVIKRYDVAGRLAFESYPMNTVGAAVYTDTGLLGTHTTYDALDRPKQVARDSEVGPLLWVTRYLSGFKTEVTDPRTTRTVTAFQAYDQPE